MKTLSIRHFKRYHLSATTRKINIPSVDRSKYKIIKSFSLLCRDVRKEAKNFPFVTRFFLLFFARKFTDLIRFASWISTLRLCSFARPLMLCDTFSLVSFFSSRRRCNNPDLFVISTIARSGNKRSAFHHQFADRRKKTFLILLHQLGLLPLLTRIRHEDHFVMVSILWI